ncbi:MULTISPECIES: hypothetical protein [Photorhabdus]|uniref:hypothetical protein n=1 Tax=Photorhabdus TaxID=29487 RepID=UPI000DCAFB2D|nr:MULTISPECIES: hypothetical protein [Photorhabdus]AXG42961.1 hypothetical protein PluDJC_12370 [Photorhabdus laumondii subsp. laumondii]MCZ1250840.1 hypothetical protein [Photorhabdus laumondii subsp. laumondii]NDL14681.1 hypothetical protein [Photorhabdus laumondii subsp. laumondii]NDL46483.1 hypothetical protein [Photorhabdus laumondii subsp. laumondii]NDL51142.1 hypothetical protein [Photorhabdus laumondii subsp. laumondii]
MYEFITTGFLVVPTYQWLMNRLSILYAPAYDAVLSLCLMVEAGWRYEVGDYQQQGFLSRPMLGIIPIGAFWRANHYNWIYSKWKRLGYSVTNAV